jgi:hypothetical protein
MIEIPLTQNKVALIDDEDWKLISQHKWHARKQNKTFYAATNISIGNGKQKIIRMHRLIMQALPGQEVDHKNNNGLDNRKDNLRFCTRTQNHQNRKNTRGTSEYKGVAWRNSRNKWMAYIVHDKKQTFLGYFSSEEDAAKEYDKAALKYFGEFARLNFERI